MILARFRSRAAVLAFASLPFAWSAVAQDAPAPDAVPVPPVTTENIPPPPPQEFDGPATALDGMTIQIEDRRFLLFGILAPDLRVAEGLRARLGLDRLIAGRSDIHCIEAPRDDGYRRRAICSSGGADLAEAMLGEGLVIVDRLQTRAPTADRELADRYDAGEAAARQSGKGVWESFREPPSLPAPPVPTRAERIEAWVERWQAGLGSLAGAIIVGLLVLIVGRPRPGAKN